MFINNLNNTQQEKLHVLTQMLGNKTTDKNIEEQTTSQLALETTFMTQTAKVSLLLELISRAYSDKKSGKNEKKRIRKIALTLNISLQLLKDMEYWVELQSILTKEAKFFMEEKSYN